MKTQALIMILLLLCTAIFASEDSSNAAEYERKTRELNQLAERFKEETGFVGEVGHSIDTMRLHTYRGNFSGVNLSAEGDTIAFRQACEQIVDKILPFSPANRMQLSMSRISKSVRGYTTDYIQQVGGYRVEGAGLIMITSDSGRKRFSIGDNTVELPDGVSVQISKEEAEQIALRAKNDELYSISKVYHLFLSKEGSESYYLAYLALVSSVVDENLDEYSYWIDALTGQIKKSCVTPRYQTDYSISVKGNYYGTTIDWGLINNQSVSIGISEARVWIDNKWSQTNNIGETTIHDVSYLNPKVRLSNNHFWMTIRTIADTLETNNFILSQDVPDCYLVQFPDSTSGIYHYAPNSYDEAVTQISYLKRLIHDYFDNHIKIATACEFGDAGEYNPTSGVIRLKDARMHYVVRHELSHHFVHRVLGSMMGSTDNSAMDEGFARYFGGASKNDPINPQEGGALYIDRLIHVSSLGLGAIYESSYSLYDCGLSIASAWWSLRGNSLFPSPEQGVAGIDTLLVAGLKIVREEIPQNNAYRYKPRYFYNILMNQVADGSASNSLNPKQIAIDKAYTSRGFHFTPQVESYSAANKLRNVFAPGDKVHVNISNAPQNTPFTVYVIRHNAYTYVDGANVSTLLPHLANGFLHPITGNHTDAQGRWDGLVWTIPTGLANVDGGYDIIVDFGSPNAPDNKIHFTYTAANVLDGFDGLHEPGFTVKTPLPIDIVFAIDCSPSMSGAEGVAAHRNHLSNVARQFIAQLDDGDRVGMFGFATNRNHVTGNLQDVKIYRIPSDSFGLMPVLNNKEYLCGDDVVNFPSGSSYTTYSTNMRTPFTHGYTSFDELDRPKHFVTLSDGWHCLPDGTTGQGGGIDNPTNDIHNRILYSYVPSGIQCHTMRYKAYPSNNNGDYPYNEAQSNTLMNSIAEWGNGSSWSREKADETYQDINAILDIIRQSSSSVDETRSYTGTNPAQGTEIIQFTVDKDAHSLIANFSIDQFDLPTAGRFNFNLVSPSGMDATMNPDNSHQYTSLWRVELPFPEQGLWNAIITRPQSGTSVSRFSFSAKVQSDLDVHFIAPPRKHKMNVPLLLSVQAFDYLEPLTEALVRVFLRRDDWCMELSLLDDGCHNDAQANDGIYSNYMYAYSNILQQYQHNAAGMYELIYELYSPSHTAKRVKKYRIELESPEDFPYVSTGRNLHSGWNWVGFPRLQRDVLGTSIDYATISLSPFLTDIMSSEGIAEYYNHRWSFYGFSSLKSEMGYKLRINNTDPVRLYELGTIIDTLMVHQLNEGQWNWVTYPCYETVYPWEALSGVLDRIDYIMAEKWSMKKERDVWIYDGLSRPHLKYGDSVMIRSTMACSFIWNNPLTTPEVNEPQKPHHYVFEDKPDYETIMIESIEGNPDYTEIGIFQDDVCIGARVIEAYPIQILAYSTPAEEGGGPLSFMLYSESKGAVSVSPATVRTGDYTANEPTIEPEQYGFRMLTLKTMDEQIPSVLALQSNYPNPFNPSTTINFSLPKTAHARLVIYNIRGQKVKVLVSDTLDYGNHSVVWNGRDSGNRPVASGVYFARLEQSGRAKIRKMMLMK